jgi:hypothetical protein
MKDRFGFRAFTLAGSVDVVRHFERCPFNLPDR